MKKTTMAVIITGSLVLAGVGSAVAHQNFNSMNRGDHHMNSSSYELDEEQVKLQEKFHKETVELRKKMFVTRTKMNVLMNNTTPDSKEAAQLAAELFDVKEQLRGKAKEAGVNTGGFGHMGRGGLMMARGMMGGNSRQFCDKQGTSGR